MLHISHKAQHQYILSGCKSDTCGTFRFLVCVKKIFNEYRSTVFISFLLGLFVGKPYISWLFSILQKARQIRSTPFTEESAESSEDEGTSDQEGTPATPRTIARRLNQSSSGATKRGQPVSDDYLFLNFSLII